MEVICIEDDAFLLLSHAACITDKLLCYEDIVKVVED
jgi:hypothetical protein